MSKENELLPDCNKWFDKYSECELANTKLLGRINRLKQENEKLKECIKYVKASHRCICNGDEIKGLECSYCKCAETLKQMKQ